MPAAGALQQRCPHRPRFVVPASRTTKTLRPAELTQILSTGLLGGETRLELGQIPRIIFHFPDPTSCGHLSQVNTHLLRYYVDLASFREMYERESARIRVLETDPTLPIHRVQTSKGALWARIPGAGRGIGWLLTEHDWMERLSSGHAVKEGDVVMDVGAHVGIFAMKALSLGASRVIAIEPDPENVECLRRNFEKEIASGRLTIVEAGAWNEPDTITLSIGESSGWNSFVEDNTYRSLDVRVLPIDDMVAELGLNRLDYIKMDIEGAEPQALEGAAETIRRFRPTVMIDTYQWADDLPVVEVKLKEADQGYEPFSGPCVPSEQSFERIIPHVTFYEPAEGKRSSSRLH